MKSNNIKGSLILCTAALIWGLAFVAQAGIADTLSTFTISASRSFVAALALFLFWKITNVKQKTTFFPKDTLGRKVYLKAAIICGLCLTVSMNLQQFGIALYPKGVAVEARSGFLTALYVIIVPIISIFLRKKISPIIWIAVITGMIGIYILCLSGGFSGIYLGDIVVFLCAISFATHILSVDKFVTFTGGIKLSILQFLTVGIVSSVFALILEPMSITALFDAAPQILYLGIMSSGVAYTLQIVGQKYAEPAVASLSMSLESVFAALGGVVISGNILTFNEIIGCTIVFIAIIVAQIPELISNKKIN